MTQTQVFKSLLKVVFNSTTLFYHVNAYNIQIIIKMVLNSTTISYHVDAYQKSTFGGNIFTETNLGPCFQYVHNTHTILKIMLLVTIVSACIKSGLSNLNHPRAAHCNSGLKAGRMKQNLGGFYRISEEF